MLVSLSIKLGQHFCCTCSQSFLVSWYLNFVDCTFELVGSFRDSKIRTSLAYLEYKFCSQNFSFQFQVFCVYIQVKSYFHCIFSFVLNKYRQFHSLQAPRIELISNIYSAKSTLSQARCMFTIFTIKMLLCFCGALVPKL